MNAFERLNRAKELRLCLNCLRRGHLLKYCEAGTCRKGDAKHNTLLHIATNRPSTTNSAVANISRIEDEDRGALSQDGTEEIVALVSETRSSCLSRSIFSTAVISITGIDGRLYAARALLDCASESNFISARLCARLALKHIPINFNLQGIANTNSSSRIGLANASISSRVNNYSQSLQFLTLPQITGPTPAFKLNITNASLAKDIQLADPKFYEPAEVDILIGNGEFWNLIAYGKISLGKGMPTLHNTVFGWVVGGYFGSPTQIKTISSYTCSASDLLHEQLQKFWQLEEISAENPIFPNSEAAKCEEHFTKTVQRAPSGRFIVLIPFKDDLSLLGNPYDCALRRFLSLERRLQKDRTLNTQYEAFMREYATLGHMTRITDEIDLKRHCYYLPHHGVINDNSETTKLRVVLDGLANSTSGKSINDLQIVGPVIQDDLFTILVRIRNFAIAITADIEKMYRQVLDAIFKEYCGDFPCMTLYNRIV